tara:strand:- start:967 stop:1203 length:237 start_codon:yes stop_codon:yes gene_type:complete
MNCKHCEHCIAKAKKEDFDTRKVYVETSRANMYLAGMTIEETEEYLTNLYGHDKWYIYSKDIPTSIKQFEQYQEKGDK